MEFIEEDVDEVVEATPAAIASLTKARSALPKPVEGAVAIDAAGLATAMAAAAKADAPQGAAGGTEAPSAAVRNLAVMEAFMEFLRTQPTKLAKDLLAVTEATTTAKVASAAVTSAAAAAATAAEAKASPASARRSTVQLLAELKVQVSRLEKKRADRLTFVTEARMSRKTKVEAKVEGFEKTIARLLNELEAHRKALVDYKAHEELADREWAESDAKALDAIDAEVLAARLEVKEAESEVAAAGDKQALRPKAATSAAKAAAEGKAGAEGTGAATASAAAAEAGGGGVDVDAVMAGDGGDGEASELGDDDDGASVVEVEAPLTQMRYFDPPNFDVAALTPEDHTSARSLRAALYLWMSQPVAVPLSYVELGVSVPTVAALVGQAAWDHCYSGAGDPQPTDPVPRMVAVVLLDAVSRLTIEHEVSAPDAVMGSLKRAATTLKMDNGKPKKPKHKGVIKGNK